MSFNNELSNNNNNNSNIMNSLTTIFNAKDVLHFIGKSVFKLDDDDIDDTNNNNDDTDDENNSDYLDHDGFRLDDETIAERWRNRNEHAVMDNEMKSQIAALKFVTC